MSKNTEIICLLFLLEGVGGFCSNTTLVKACKTNGLHWLSCYHLSTTSYQYCKQLVLSSKSPLSSSQHLPIDSLSTSTWQWQNQWIPLVSNRFSFQDYADYIRLIMHDQKTTTTWPKPHPVALLKL